MRDIAPLPNAPSRDPGAPPSPRAAAGWPRDAAVSLHERLGEMYMERKRYADAELAYACAVGVARMDIGDGAPGAEPPVVADLLAHHAETLHLLGRADDARARLAEALRLDAENELAKKLQQTLQR
jgi:tetratricopeptide (TPR) repeat protein